MMKKYFQRCKKWCVGLALSALFTAYGASFEDLLFTVQQDGRENGSGFLLNDSEGVWMVSNYHVVRAAEKIRFVGMNDTTRIFLFPKSIQVAANRDAIRFKTEEQDGFKLAATSVFDEVVFAYGNSDGLGVITKSEGKVVGKGRGQIEVTCEIIPGNSGGPVINKSNEVIGVSTFTVTVPSVKIAAELSGTVSAAERERLAEKIKTRRGTRYLESRRFAIPLKDAEWQDVDFDLFSKEAKLYKELDDRYDRFGESIAEVFSCNLIHAENESLFERGWVRNYNRDLYEYGSTDSESGRYYIKAGCKESFERAYGRWFKALSEASLRLANEFREQAQGFEVRYCKNEIIKCADSLERRSRELMEVASKYGR